MTQLADQRVATYPVVEVFGPTIQGEGAMAGLPTYFVRLGGCDWRCAWCDSMHAVDPAQVRLAPRMTDTEIANELFALDDTRAHWVTLSGGNPALHDLQSLVDKLHALGKGVAVETQGSRWRSWLANVNHLTVSPKPPSSGEATERNADRVRTFMSTQRAHAVDTSLKIVVFDEADLEFALATARQFHWLPFYISCGTDSIGRETLQQTAERYRWLCEAVARNGSPEAMSARVLPQLHVIAWAHKLAV